MYYNYRPRIIPVPIIPIIGEDEDTNEKIKSSDELEKKLLAHIDKKFASFSIPTGSAIELESLRKAIKDTLKTDMAKFINEKCVDLKIYEADKLKLEQRLKQQFAELFNSKIREINPDLTASTELLKQLRTDVDLLNTRISSSNLDSFVTRLEALEERINTSSSNINISEITSSIAALRSEFDSRIERTNERLEVAKVYAFILNLEGINK
jgi:hypothetical protein